MAEYKATLKKRYEESVIFRKKFDSIKQAKKYAKESILEENLAKGYENEIYDLMLFGKQNMSFNYVVKNNQVRTYRGGDQ